jgi:hypothetical protein
MYFHVSLKFLPLLWIGKGDLCIPMFAVTLIAVVPDIPALTLVMTVTLFTKEPLTLVFADLEIHSASHLRLQYNARNEREDARQSQSSYSEGG